MLGRLFVLIGLFFLGVGFLLTVAQKLGWSHLPGDIVIKKGNFTFYFSLTTSVLLSILFSLIFYWLNRK